MTTDSLFGAPGACPEPLMRKGPGEDDFGSPATGVRAIVASTLARVAVAAAAALACTVAQAALIDRGGGLIYDTVLDVTWLADMNYARTQYDSTGGLQGTANGAMTWGQAQLWATGLTYGGYSDWRLPTTLQPDPSCSLQFDAGNGAGPRSAGFGCLGSEMGHLFHADLGGHPDESVLDGTGDTALELANRALFSHVDGGAFGKAGAYWSSTTYAPTVMAAWSFFMFDGQQEALSQDFQLLALAVRPGDSVAPLPEPPGGPLVATALAALALMRRCRGRSRPT